LFRLVSQSKGFVQTIIGLFKPTSKRAKQKYNEEPQQENIFPSVYDPDNPEATEDDDMEEDLGLLGEPDEE